MKLTTARPEYLPDLNYFWNIAQSDLLILTDHFQFVKRSSITVSPPLSGFGSSMHIPVKHTGAPVPIMDKKVSLGRNWRVKHFKSIYHQFHLAPFGYYYLPLFEEIYKDNTDSLSDFLIILLKKIIYFFHLQIEILRASDIGFSQNSNETIVDWCQNNSALHYITSDEVVQNRWINMEMIEENGIELSTYSALPNYNILTSYNGFSVIGFLMQYGPEAGYILKQYLPRK